ncbi:MAG TPA: hypothetical protein VG756_20980 [Pseudonocardiaceae bacterium]|jgi:hypothetical protein|nr:hypothetical protein [Pseudonocardiaceae bacterium]
MSIEAIATTLSEVRAEILAAHHDVRAARVRLAEAVELLTELSRNHPESLVPPGFSQADEQLSGGLESLAGSLAAIERFQNGL